MIKRAKVSININDRIVKYGIPYDVASSFLKAFTRMPPYDVPMKNLIKKEFKSGKSVEEVGTEVIRAIAIASSETALSEDPMGQKIQSAYNNIVGLG